jgi:alcohol dehydrogenase class IV
MSGVAGSGVAAAWELITSPRIIFGAGRIAELARLVPGFGHQALLVIGGASAERSGLRERLAALFHVGAVVSCAREPTVEDVDAAVRAGREAACDVVVAVGGGSVLDCGKAAAGLLSNGGELTDYLEGLGKERAVEKPPLPLIAAPTTAGTGSEVTKNAVITGPGFKKSIRSPLLVPRVALVDPELTRGAPREVVASCGMDALVQLVEAYLSRNANPVTDGLALQGIAAAGRALERAVQRPDDAAREDMALAGLLGGICLANAGLGAVHGLASPLGAFFPIPHGVACAALLPQVLLANLRAAAGTTADAPLRRRVAAVADALTARRFASADPITALDACVAELERLQRCLAIPRLGKLGVTEADFPRLVAGSRGSSMRYNPVELSDEQIEEILRAAF